MFIHYYLMVEYEKNCIHVVQMLKIVHEITKDQYITFTSGNIQSMHGTMMLSQDVQNYTHTTQISNKIENNIIQIDRILYRL